MFAANFENLSSGTAYALVSQDTECPSKVGLGYQTATGQDGVTTDDQELERDLPPTSRGINSMQVTVKLFNLF